MNLLLKEIKDSYIRENFKKVQEAFGLLGTGGDVTNVRNVTNVTSGGADNFSYNFVPLGTTLTIPANQQMIVADEWVVEGDVVMEGDVVLI